MAPRLKEESYKENPRTLVTTKCRSEQTILLADITNKTIAKQKTLRKNKKTVKRIPIIEDLDLHDHHDPQLVTEYLPHILAYIRQLELSSPIGQNFLLHSPISGSMRSILLDWLVDVQVMFNLLPETLHMAQFMLDTFLQKEGKKVTKEKLQLVGAACMFTASKAEETNFPSVSDFVYISDNAFTTRQVIAMERRILRGINFNLFRPPPITFLRRFCKAGGVTDLHHNMANYVMETALLKYELVHHPPSKLAAASLLLCLLLLNPSSTPPSCWSPTLQHHSGYTAGQLEPLVLNLANVMAAVKDGNLNAVTKKYEVNAYGKVSLMKEFGGDRLESLALKHRTE